MVAFSFSAENLNELVYVKRLDKLSVLVNKPRFLCFRWDRLRGRFYGGFAQMLLLESLVSISFDLLLPK